MSKMVYCHIFADGKLYFDLADRINPRWWAGEVYKGNRVMYEHIQRDGWESMEHLALTDLIRDEVAQDLETILINIHESYEPKKGHNIIRYLNRYTTLCRDGKVNQLLEKYGLGLLDLSPLPNAQEQIERYKQGLIERPIKTEWEKEARHQWDFWAETNSDEYRIPLYENPDYIDFRNELFATWRKQEQERAEKSKKWARDMYANDGFAKREADRLYWAYVDENKEEKRQMAIGIQRAEKKKN